MRLFPLLATLLLLALPLAARGQRPDTAWGGGASPLLPPDHWAVGAARRAEALGLAPDYLPAQRAVPRRQVGVALARAAARAEGRDPATAGLARSWYARFVEEFPEIGEPDRGVGLLGSAVAAGYRRREGGAEPGLGMFAPERSGALPLEDRAGAVGALDLAASFGRHLALAARPEVSADGADLGAGDVVLAWGSWYLTAGRGPLGYGAGVGGGVVLSGDAVLDRVQAATSGPVRLPGFLRHLGPISFHTAVARLDDVRHPGAPFLWTASGSLRPHPRVTLSVHRAAQIGGDRILEPVTVGRLLQTLVGGHTEIENQIVSAELRYRLPSEELIPLTAYCEWGAEDSAGAFYDVPGVVCGAFLPAVPALPQLALGAEHARFATSCCGNPEWYRHLRFPGSWAADDMPLGHPLGGAGREWLGYVQASALDSRVQLEGRVFRRERHAENLYVPGRAGESTGVEVDLLWRLLAGAELHARIFREAGEGWEENRVELGSRVLFDL